MKRTAIVLGVAAALAVPSVASAGASPQVVAQVKPQVRAQVVDTQIASALVAKRKAALAQVVAHRRTALGTKIVLHRIRTLR